MKPLDLAVLAKFIEKRIVEFHKARLGVLERLDMPTLLSRKNPYLFKAKNLNRAQDLMLSILDAYLASSEEELFGQFLEDLAIFIAEQRHQGFKSTRQGIDLEFERADTYYFVQIKSSPHWGNSSQRRRLAQEFAQVLSDYQAQKPNNPAQAVLGVCYGKRKASPQGAYLTLYGQAFWYFLSDSKSLYLDVIEPIGHQAKGHNHDFSQQRDALINRLTRTVLEQFCTPKGDIDWQKLVQFNSGNLD